MLHTLQIQNFKCFRDLSFPALKRVNLIAGKNNTGKTAVLEALLLLLDFRTFASQLPVVFRNCVNLGNAFENYWKWVFTDRDLARPAFLSGRTDDYSNYRVGLGLRNQLQGYSLIKDLPLPQGLELGIMTLKAPESGAAPPERAAHLRVAALPARPSDPQQDAIGYDRVVLKASGERRLEDLLRGIEPRLRGIRSIRPYGATLIYVDLDGLKEKIPAIHLGQGFLRLLSIYSEIIAGDKRVLVIDEIENGLHYSVLPDVWRGILRLAEEENVQVFATTHSYECIRAAHLAFAETLDYDFALHRLEEVQGNITVTTLDKEAMETSLASNFEVR